MAGYRIVPGDMRQFSAAFRDTECALCARQVSRGDPIGYLDYYSRTRRFGPLCVDCLGQQGVRFSVTTLPDNRQPNGRGR
jgi:hypothetical protein